MDMAETSDPVRLQVPVDNNVDHFIGDEDAEITVVEYGSYSCVHCHAAHEVIAGARESGARPLVHPRESA